MYMAAIDYTIGISMLMRMLTFSDCKRKLAICLRLVTEYKSSISS